MKRDSTNGATKLPHIERRRLSPKCFKEIYAKINCRIGHKLDGSFGYLPNLGTASVETMGVVNDIVLLINTLFKLKRGGASTVFMYTITIYDVFWRVFLDVEGGAEESFFFALGV